MTDEDALDIVAELGRLRDEVNALAETLEALLQEARRTNELLSRIRDAIDG